MILKAKKEDQKAFRNAVYSASIAPILSHHFRAREYQRRIIPGQNL
jgi:hypothetical protein